MQPDCREDPVAGLGGCLRTRLALTFSLAAVIVASLAVAALVHNRGQSDAPTVELTFLHISDLHAHYHPRAFTLFGDVSPLALIKGFIDEQRAERPGALVIDSGDAFEKGSLADLHSRGKSTVELYRELGVDLMTLGNHDFAYGSGPALDLCSVAATRCIVTNHRYRGEPSRAPLAYHEFTHRGVRIGVFGLVTKPYNEMDRPVDAPYNRDFDARYDNVEVAREVVRAKRGQVDLLILISHLTPSQDRTVADKVEGIDLIFGGHSHAALEEPLVSKQGTLVMNAGCCGQFVGRLVLDFDSRSRRIRSHDFELVDVDAWTMPHDRDYAKKIGQVIGKYAPDAAAPACDIDRDLSDNDLAQTIAAAAREHFEADAVVVKANLVQGGMPAGQFTRQDLHSRFHVEHQPPETDGWTNFTKVSLSGQDLQAMKRSMSQDLHYVGIDDIEPSRRYGVVLHRMHALNMTTFFPDVGIGAMQVERSEQIWRLLADHCRRREDKALALQRR